ncbi:DUF4184 family protein [Leptolyngbyaceae cyanobacterium CCMR0082]|uniref:DUF4184 family protein n=2 Tax=Adonisia turfae TaxID=2950184 RepID=A0A6M0RZB5_9CYAN|nr:DUF4184 family protein [Adonisia turfae]NEZ54379.1 DUF4184 family protein [Adonisia turfae CCMR0081]NEZ61569.1 DUF4184 family protein [Adonisia turfae CCMR0082]
MPYTPAHTIVAAPLWYLSQKRLPLPPLIIGCMAPDLPYFLYLNPIYSPGHSISGLITHAVPQGLLALGLWYLWLEKSTLTLFGLAPSKRQVSLSWLGLVILSLWLGAATHSFLDATSHEWGWFVQRFAGLRYPLGGLPIFKWVQYGGGAMGLTAILSWYLSVAKVPSTANRSVQAGVTILSFSTLSLMGLANWVHQSQDLQSFAINSASGAMSGFVVGLCLFSVFYRIRRLRVS